MYQTKPRGELPVPVSLAPGSQPLLSSACNRTPRESCRRFEAHRARLHCSFERARAGKSIAARMAMMATTTSSSIKVKANTGSGEALPPPPDTEIGDVLRGTCSPTLDFSSHNKKQRSETAEDRCGWLRYFAVPLHEIEIVASPAKIGMHGDTNRQDAAPGGYGPELRRIHIRGELLRPIERRSYAIGIPVNLPDPRRRCLVDGHEVPAHIA